MTDITSIKLLKNMPDFVYCKKWLAFAAMCTAKQRKLLQSYNLLDDKDQNIIQNKCRALNRSIRDENWRDFDMIDISDAHVTVLTDMANSFIASVPDVGLSQTEVIATSGDAIVEEPDDAIVEEPMWVSRKWSRVCRCFQIGGKCPHEGKTCSFAHSVEQLSTGIKQCAHGDQCYHWCYKHECRHGAIPCECMHPGEDVYDVISRLELAQELPLVSEPVVSEPVVSEPITDEQYKKTKTVYATESEQLKNMLFEMHMLLFEKDQELADKALELEQLRKEMNMFMQKNNTSALVKHESKKLTIDVAIAEASTPVTYTFSC